MKSNLFIGFVFTVSFLMVQCKSKKAVTEYREPKELVRVPKTEELVLEKINQSVNDFNYYQAKGVLKFDDGKQKQEVDVNIIMEKGRYIWMNVTAVLGVEVARVYITNDSVKILDRLHRKYIETDFAWINGLLNTPMKLENLQNLLVGNTIFNNYVQKSVIDTLLGNLAVYTNLQKHKQSTFYSPQFKVQRSEINETETQRLFKVAYEGFYESEQNKYPQRLDIHIRAEKNIDCTLQLGNFVFEKKREVQFTVPSSYERVKP